MDGELDEPAISKQEDEWLLGKHKLICGDSTDMDTYTKLMEGKKANMVVTDPPYNVAYEGTAGKIKNDNMEDKKFHEFLLNAYKGMYESLADVIVKRYIEQAGSEDSAYLIRNGGKLQICRGSKRNHG